MAGSNNSMSNDFGAVNGYSLHGSIQASTSHVNTDSWSEKDELTFNLPPRTYRDYEALALELGADFYKLAPNLASEWEEIKSIYNHRKTISLLGVINESD